jgi:hypothetical protein
VVGASTGWIGGASLDGHAASTKDFPVVSQQPAAPARRTRLTALLAVLLPLLGSAAGAVYLYFDDGWSRVGLGALVALAALMCGGLVGFLFGVPRTPQGDQRGGTNLEQVSDWLTKILVGVALIYLSRLGDAAGRLFTTVGDALGGGQPAHVAAGAGLSFFAITGFLIAYVMARTVLRGLFEWFDSSQVGGVVEATVDERSNRDAEAIRLATGQLDVHCPDVDAKLLHRTLADATPAVRTHVFLLAKDQRSNTWRDPATKPKTTRTIPVFQALADLEPANHRHWGELGFALKDQATPDRLAAITALDTAIQRRGDAAEHGYELYEFARALARAGQLNTTPLDNGSEAAIRQDLAVAYRNENIRRRITEAQRRIVDRGEHVDFADLEIDRVKQFLPK